MHKILNSFLNVFCSELSRRANGQIVILYIMTFVKNLEENEKDFIYLDANETKLAETMVKESLIRRNITINSIEIVVEKVVENDKVSIFTEYTVFAILVVLLCFFIMVILRWISKGRPIPCKERPYIVDETPLPPIPFVNNSPRNRQNQEPVENSQSSSTNSENDLESSSSNSIDEKDEVLESEKDLLLGRGAPPPTMHTSRHRLPADIINIASHTRPSNSMISSLPMISSDFNSGKTSTFYPPVSSEPNVAEEIELDGLPTT